MKQHTKICILLMALTVLGTTSVWSAQTVKKMGQSEYQRRVELQRRNGIKAGNIYRDIKKVELHQFALIPEFESQERWKVSMEIKDEVFDADPEGTEEYPKVFEVPRQTKTTRHQYFVQVTHKNNSIIIEQQMPVDASVYFGRVVIRESAMNPEVFYEPQRIHFQPIDEAIEQLKAAGVPFKPNQRRLIKQHQLAFARHFGVTLWGGYRSAPQYAKEHDESNRIEEVWSKPLDFVESAYRGSSFRGFTFKSKRPKYTKHNDGRQYLLTKTEFMFDLRKDDSKKILQKLCWDKTGQIHVGAYTNYHYVLELQTHRTRHSRAYHQSDAFECVDNKPVFASRRTKSVEMRFERVASN